MNQIGWYAILLAAGFAAGVVNTIAGGGSFLTLPALMIFGMDPKLANGTNRLAVLFSSASAVATFSRHDTLDYRIAMRLALPTMAGVPIGALLAVYLPAESFKMVFGLIILGMAVVIVMNPKRMLQTRELKNGNSKLLFPMFFCIGVYVGFIQAGMGILLLIAMSYFSSADLFASNAIKNLIGFLVTLAATIFFIVFGMVSWAPGLTMAVGNLAGGIVGAKLVIKKGNRLIFGCLVVVMLATGFKLLFSGLADGLSASGAG